MSEELDCQWHFDSQSGREEGADDGFGQNFRKKPYASLVREAIQNSLDVPISNDKPVEVNFSFGILKPSEFPNFYKIKDHIQGCMDYFNENDKVKAICGEMLSFLRNECKDEMPYIKVSDFHTQGMVYRENDNNNPFYAFVRAAAISVKNGGSGGSYGFGKAAYFQMSPINTVLVSTMTPDKMYFFEGASVLCTHTYNGEKVTSVGYYDNNYGKPICSLDRIPACFQRSEPGTDIYILGFSPSPNDTYFDDMVKEVLRSYFAAVEMGKLIVVIKSTLEEVHIDKNHIKKLLDCYFRDQNNGLIGVSLNPIPFYDAFTHEDDGKQFRTFRGETDLLGDFCLMTNIIKDDNPSDKILYMRKPLMMVEAKKTNTSLGLYGVFICSSPQGDSLLRKLENSSHSEWRKENNRNIQREIIEEGAQAIAQIREFCDNCISELSKIKAGDGIDIGDMINYSPTGDADTSSESVGNPDDNQTDEGGAATTTASTIENQPSSGQHSIGTIFVQTTGSITGVGNGGNVVGVGHKKKVTKEKGGLPAGGTQITTATTTPEGSHITVLNVPIRVVAQTIKDTIYHYVIIHSNQEITNGTIELIVCGEQSNDSVKIAYTSKGAINGNKIQNLSLSEGKETIEIRFADSLMHTVKTKLYYED